MNFRATSRLLAAAAAAAAAVLAWAPAVSRAANTTTTFTVSVNVISGCAIQSATNLDFGSYLQNSPSNLTGTSTITVLCSTGTPYVIALSAGNSGSTTQRYMPIPGHGNLNYNLYTTSTYTSAYVWHDTSDANCTNTGGTSTNCEYGTGIGSNQAFTVYGQIPSAQNPGGTGAGTDTITVTVTF